MVDALLEVSRDQGLAPTGAMPAVGARLTTDPLGIERLIDTIDAGMIFTGYQHPDFLRAWTQLAGCRPMFITLSATGHGPVLLPFEVCDNRVSGYCGDRHANGNFPVGRPEDIEALAKSGREAIVSALKTAGLPTSTIVAERQHASWAGVSNPLVFKDSVASPNIALSFTLDGDFETVARRQTSKAKRKKMRSYRRKLEEFGAIEFLHPVALAETDRFLDAFFALKAERFRKAGIVNVFADERTRAFFRALFAAGTTHQLHALMINGEIAAVIGCTIHDERFTVEFGTFDERFGDARPGEMLFQSVIEHACDQGYQIFDFGIGDEPYKRRWCDIETTHYDTAIGLTPAGQIRAGAHQARSHLVRAIKSNDRVWSAVKSLRSKLHRS